MANLNHIMSPVRDYGYCPQFIDKERESEMLSE